jgi:hypothetical protein
MITVEEMIKSLKEEEPGRLIRMAQIIFDDHDRFALMRGGVRKSKKVREKEKQAAQ